MRCEGQGKHAGAGRSAGAFPVFSAAVRASALTHFPHPLKFHGDRSKQ